MKHNLEQFERSVCDCNKCKAGCRTMPGSCATGDIERIAAYVGADDVDKFASNNFCASDGAKVLTPDGVMTIPTIVPKQREDGRCVFLTADERCSVHAVSPYGCRNFTICNQSGESDEEMNRKSSAHLMGIMAGDEASREYVARWSGMVEEGNTAAPILERREKLEKELVGL